MTHPATTLRQILNVSARAVQLYGATSKQIDMIVALARASGDYNVWSGGNLTKSEASSIIDHMIGEGIKPDFQTTDGENDDYFSRQEKLAKDNAARKSFNSHKKKQKEDRDAAKAEKLRQVDGRRVRHTKFGDGTVVSEDANAATVMFDGQAKPKRMVPNVLEEI